MKNFILIKPTNVENGKKEIGLIMSHPDVFGYFWIRNFFFQDTAIVHASPAYPADESATFWIRSPEWKFLNPLRIRKRVIRSSPVLYREYSRRSEQRKICRFQNIRISICASLSEDASLFTIITLETENPLIFLQARQSQDSDVSSRWG